MIFVSFALAIGAGSAMLYLESFSSGMPVRWVDALFTITSATCVTGLATLDTGTAFSLTGQLIILSFIQLGGLGIVTLSSGLLLLLGHRPSFSERSVATETFGLPTHIPWQRLLRRVIAYTFTIEAIGAALLYLRFSALYPGEPGRAWYVAIFHAISAFCNAGFSLFPDSLERFRYDPLVNLVIMALIILGGIGFFVLEEIRAWIWRRLSGKTWRWSLHTRVVLVMSAALIVAGAVLLFALESFNPRMLDAPWYGRLWPAFFQSVTSRTAGFNTVPIGGMTNASLMLVILLMFVGGSPGSTAGGIKTTTLAILLMVVWSRMRGRADTEAAGRRIPQDLVVKSIAVTLAFAFAVVLFTLLLQVTEVGGAAPDAAVRGRFFELTFESMSAFGTVGLSMGVTPTLTTVGKLLIALAMFAGRLGPLSFALSLLGELRGPAYHYPEERVMIG